MYTVELYKQDRRMKSGERLIRKSDHSTADRAAIQQVYADRYPEAQGYRWVIVETYVTRKNILSGQEFQERYDTPYYCSPSSETYWSS